MANICIAESDYDHDPLTESMSKLSMVVVNTRSTAKAEKVPDISDGLVDRSKESASDSDVIDLTLDSDSEQEGDEYKCFKSDQLSEEMLELIRSEEYPKNQSFNNFVQIYLDNIPITATLLKNLVLSNSWLNDEMINAFFKLLGTAYQRSSFLNTFFFTNLVAGVDVHSWVQKATGSKSLFEYDHLIFPINHGNTHWSLGVLFIKEMELVHYDSLGSSLSKMRSGYSNLVTILEKEAKEKYLPRIDNIEAPLFTAVEEVVVSIKSGKSPRQVDGSSCGVHTCFTAHRIAKREPLDFTSYQVSSYRKKMASNLALQ